MTLRQPGHLRGSRSAGILGVLLLAVAGCGGGNGGPATPAPTSVPSPAAVTPAAPTSVPASPAGTPTTSLQVLDFKLNPFDLTVRSGLVSIIVDNAGPTVHNVAIRGDDETILGTSPDLREGESGTLEATLEPGSYTLFCSLPGHESLGIKGTLTVTAE
jgi:plastocyanin